ncbi:hypothetical protein N658DRAFT_436644 [Parathielavia hyrcaniae]|uniref:Deacetylase sirtuin-type domain-containing protein n=1 Tax=Parathielavia hyrcaniae TaxID=113614 RepID=A0AAN6PSF9_9PEZI|nr:hypothetical protein N658DRAFT_436644 [Parathielavia hyrcaniae]
MPTTHVGPLSGPLLQDIAYLLWKSRKVVVITGAGISTNSGIPDFRSKNGLYSLIQAQFEAAQQGAAGNGEADISDASLEQRPTKRQRRAYDGSDRRPETHDIPFPGLRNAAPNTVDPSRNETGRMEEEPCGSQRNGALPSPSSESDPVHRVAQSPHGVEVGPGPTFVGCSPPGGPVSLQLDSCKTVRAVHTRSEPPAVEATPPMPSSPPTLTLGTPRPRSRARLFDSPPESSSPLSSPPQITFNPYSDSTDCSSSQDTESSCSRSEGPSSVSTPRLSSQTSFASARATLPIMKGRDLFDAQIWSCPIKTSVFYTFVSTLRQKVQNAEPTDSHRFLSVLRDSRKLVRCYTQNIDQLEERVGLSTSLSLGVGSKYRFSARAGRNSAAARGLKSAGASSDASNSMSQHPDPGPTPDDVPSSTPSAPTATSAPTAPNRGVECVFLHGSLAGLRCFVCGRTASWEEDTRLSDTLAGNQPTCPHCAGATAAREERGKRALGVGKLRPDIVLYGEEHPQAHLISPLIQHDLSLGPDMLLILGTSMRVHGLKVLVKEFAKAVHDRGGKVVFVNFTKPPESVWADIIDYWVEWDCDAWVSDLQQRKPALWLPPGTALLEDEKPKTSKLSRRQSGVEPGRRKEGADKTFMKPKDVNGASGFPKAEDTKGIVQDGQTRAQQSPRLYEMPRLLSQPPPPKAASRKPPTVPREPKLNPDAKRPASIRDHKLNGAYLVWKIAEDLRRITGGSPAQSTAPRSDPTPARLKVKKPRRSAPAALGFRRLPAASSDAIEGNETPTHSAAPVAPVSSSLLNTGAVNKSEEIALQTDSSISTAVKTRKRKQAVTWRMVGGVETRVSLNSGAEPEPASLPHSTAVFQLSPVPDSRRLPPLPPTTPQLPQYQPLAGVARPRAALPNQASHTQFSAPSPTMSVVEQVIESGFRETDRLIAQFYQETRLSRPATPSQTTQPQLRLPSLSVLLEQQAQDHYREPSDLQLKSHLQQLYREPHGPTKLTPLEPKYVSPGPRKGISSNVGSPVVVGSRTAPDPFFFADPLVGWLGSPPPLWSEGSRQLRQLRQQQQDRHHHNHHHDGQRQEHRRQVKEAVRILAAAGAGEWEEAGELTGASTRGSVREYQHGLMSSGREEAHDESLGLGLGLGLGIEDLRGSEEGRGPWGLERSTTRDRHADSSEERESGSWCPEEQLRKEQEAAIMLSSLRGSAGEYC